MSQYSIRLFGGLEVVRDERQLPPLETQKSKELFAYLVLNVGRRVPRDVLCGQLWGERPDPDARKALRTALWRVRRLLRDGGGDRAVPVVVDRSGIGYADRLGSWADVWAFEECLRSSNGQAVDDTEGAGRLLQAAELYRGDLLEGVHEAWCEATRDRLRLDYLTALERLLDYHWRRGEWLQALTWGNRLLREDPLREHVHRTVMLCHLARGDRPSALRQYQHCARTLDDELGIGPMRETVHVRDRALDESAPDRESGVSKDAGGAERLMATVDGALRDLYHLAGRLEQARSALTRPARHDDSEEADAAPPTGDGPDTPDARGPWPPGRGPQRPRRKSRGGSVRRP